MSGQLNPPQVTLTAGRNPNQVKVTLHHELFDKPIVYECSSDLPVHAVLDQAMRAAASSINIQLQKAFFKNVHS
jgi:hypothetical protein